MVQNPTFVGVIISKVAAAHQPEKHRCTQINPLYHLSLCSKSCAAEPEASDDETHRKPQHLPRPQGPDPRARVHRPRPVSACVLHIPSIRRFDLLRGINHNCHSSVTPSSNALLSLHPFVYIWCLCFCISSFLSFLFCCLFLSFFIFPLQSNSQSIMAEEGWGNVRVSDL